MNSKGINLRTIGIPEIRHFLYKSKSNAQLLCSEITAPYNTPDEFNRLESLYYDIHHCIHSSNRPTKLIYQLRETEIILAWVNTEHIYLIAWAHLRIWNQLQNCKIANYFELALTFCSQACSVHIVFVIARAFTFIYLFLLISFQITNGYELYVIFEPTVDKSAVITLVNKLLGWIKKEEEMLFILQAPTFWQKDKNSFMKIFSDNSPSPTWWLLDIEFWQSPFPIVNLCILLLRKKNGNKNFGKLFRIWNCLFIFRGKKVSLAKIVVNGIVYMLRAIIWSKFSP